MCDQQADDTNPTESNTTRFEQTNYTATVTIEDTGVIAPDKEPSEQREALKEQLLDELTENVSAITIQSLSVADE